MIRGAKYFDDIRYMVYRSEHLLISGNGSAVMNMNRISNCSHTMLLSRHNTTTTTTTTTTMNIIVCVPWSILNHHFSDPGQQFVKEVETDGWLPHGKVIL